MWVQCGVGRPGQVLSWGGGTLAPLCPVMFRSDFWVLACQCYVRDRALRTRFDPPYAERLAEELHTGIFDVIFSLWVVISLWAVIWGF